LDPEVEQAAGETVGVAAQLPVRDGFRLTATGPVGDDGRLVRPAGRGFEEVVDERPGAPPAALVIVLCGRRRPFRDRARSPPARTLAPRPLGATVLGFAVSVPTGIARSAGRGVRCDVAGGRRRLSDR
jgi:hypothetical protein